MKMKTFLSKSYIYTVLLFIEFLRQVTSSVFKFMLLFVSFMTEARTILDLDQIFRTTCLSNSLNINTLAINKLCIFSVIALEFHRCLFSSILPVI